MNYHNLIFLNYLFFSSNPSDSHTLQIPSICTVARALKKKKIIIIIIIIISGILKLVTEKRELNNIFYTVQRTSLWAHAQEIDNVRMWFNAHHDTQFRLQVFLI